ncbi:MAG: YggT family protein [Actinobacteria bacterium]|nr:MAG: YggT family protein [Actinomycetota bacterium]
MPDSAHDPERREHIEVEKGPTGERAEAYTVDVAAERRALIWKITGVLWLILGVIEAFIGIRVILKLLGANPANPFAQFVYSISRIFVAPFFGLFGEPAAGRSVLEITSLVAMVVYVLVFFGIDRLIWLLLYRTTDRSVRTYRRR